jgi:hypothetical protein
LPKGTITGPSVSELQQAFTQLVAECETHCRNETSAGDFELVVEAVVEALAEYGKNAQAKASLDWAGSDPNY